MTEPSRDDSETEATAEGPASDDADSARDDKYGWYLEKLLDLLSLV